MTLVELIEKLNKLKNVHPGTPVVVSERENADRSALFDIVDVERIEFSDGTHRVLLKKSDQFR